MPEITIIKTFQQGGPSSTAKRLQEGLEREGFKVKTFTLRKKFFSRFVKGDLKISKQLNESDALLYLNSAAGPSHFLTKVPRIGLFLHGFVEHEASNIIRNRKDFTKKLDEVLILAYWKNLNKRMNNFDFIITRSLTTYLENGIDKKNVVLPQFIFQDDLEASTRFLSEFESPTDVQETVNIVIYTSFGDSPRLLKPWQIHMLSKMLKKKTNKPFKFTIIDPLGKVGHGENIEMKRYLPFDEFQMLLASSDIYLDCLIDEEFRNVNIDAGLLKTPVAKITAPSFYDRQDYTEDEVIVARSIPEMSDKLAQCINDIDECHSRYDKAVKRFITRKRQWDHVKNPLLDALKMDHTN